MSDHISQEYADVGGYKTLTNPASLHKINTIKLGIGDNRWLQKFV